MLPVEHSVAVITGGASGIGLSLAKFWAEAGGKVVLADLDADALEIAKSQISGDVATVVCDITKEEDNHHLAKTAIDTFGAINLVVPSAGIIKDGLLVSPDRETGKVTRKMSLVDFQKVLDVNLTGVFLTVRETVEQMVNHRCRGLICLISSTGSLGTAGQINYSSTKAAVSVMPKVLTAEFFRRGIAHRIRCVAVAPGYVATPILEGMNQAALQKVLQNVPIGRLVDPIEIASLVKELYRNEALTGDVYYVHGGLRLGARG